MSDRRTLQLAHRGGQRGQALVEFALVLPLLLIVLFIAVDFGVGLTRWIAITNAAREGARLGAVGADEAAIRLKTIDASNGILTDADVLVGFSDADADGDIDRGDSVVVDVSYDYDLITPLGRFITITFDTLTLSACSDMRVEQSTGQVIGGPQGCD
jgi:Flp pilus assembly protein TadG